MDKFPTIYYRIDSTSIFSESASLVHKNEFGIFTIQNDILKISLKQNFQNLDEIKIFLEPILRSWYLEAEITRFGSGLFQFRFYNSDIPHENKDRQYQVEELKFQKDVESKLIIEITVYPPYPVTLFTVEMEAAWNRYSKARIGFGESVESSTYFILTVLTNTLKKGLKETAKTLSIDFQVLKKLGELSSTRGDLNSSRKLLEDSNLELTYKEKIWIDQVVRIALLQLGKYNNGIPLDKVKMQDFIQIGK